MTKKPAKERTFWGVFVEGKIAVWGCGASRHPALYTTKQTAILHSGCEINPSIRKVKIVEVSDAVF